MIDNKEQTTIFDHETLQTISIGSNAARRLLQGIVNINGRLPEMGYFTPNLAKNIYVRFMGGTYTAISKDVFVDKFLIFDNNIGQYGYHIGQDDLVQIKAFSTYKGKGGYPYNTIRRDYNAQNNLERFSLTANSEHTFTSKYKELVPFTFGLEYETSCGYIPEDLCYSKGLIPLRDGSITGIEYASIVLDPSKNGFELLKEQLDILRKYTDYDKECSLHIHFGNYPVDVKAITTLYFVCEALQRTLYSVEMLPKFTFHTAEYKANGKDYCKMLPRKESFNDIYNFLSGGETPGFLGSLTIPHPRDNHRETKWNIYSRYYFMNLINMCFYQDPKTVEMRFLRPTYNYNKIVNWIFIFNAILLFSIKIADTTKKLTDKSSFDLINKLFKCSLEDFKFIFQEVSYPKKVVDELMIFLNNLTIITKKQHQLYDYIGAVDTFDDAIIDKSVFDV